LTGGEFTVNTDINGTALLPEYAKGGFSVIYKNNHITVIDTNTSSKKYILKRTSKYLDSIGMIDGKVIRFDENEILTLDYHGVYRVYNYSANSVKNIFTVKLGDSVKAIKHFEIYSDTLWVSTHSSGIYAFLINDILSPSLLFHFNVDGIIDPFYVRDSILAVISSRVLRVLVFNNNNEFYELSRIKTDARRTYRDVNSIRVKDNYLFTLGLKNLPSVYDISNPDLFRLVSQRNNIGYEKGFFFKDYLILVPEWYNPNVFSTHTHKIIDLFDPYNPVDLNSFNSDIMIEGFSSDTTAYGLLTDGIFSVAEGSINTSFSTVATVVRFGYQGSQETISGVRHPYYIFKSGLLRLRER